MSKFTVIGMGAVSLGLAGLCHADPTVTAEESILSGVQDASNMFSASTNYGFMFSTPSTDPDFYLNSIGLTGGTVAFNPNANFVAGGPLLTNGFTSNNYTLGTGLGGGNFLYWSNVFSHSGAFDPSLAPVGIYSFDAVFTGGWSPTDNSVVLTVPLTVEIVNTIDATVTTQAIPGSIGPGQTSFVSATLQNNMDRPFVTTTYFVSGMSNGTNYLTGNFNGGTSWFDQTVAPHGQLSGPHSTWTDSPTQPIGTYTGTQGIVGGLYNGDNFYFGNTPNTTIQVASVPEPGTLSMGLVAGIAALVRRRKRNTKA